MTYILTFLLLIVTVKPGQGGATMNGFRVVVQGEGKRKRNAEYETPILDFLYT